MSTRGRPRKTTEERKPASIQFPYQEFIWNKHLSVAEQEKYIRHYSNTIRARGTPSDIYDYYQKSHTHDAHFPPDFPPRDPRWQPLSQQTASSTPSDVVPGPPRVDPAPTTTSPRPLDDFTEGLRAFLPEVTAPPARQPRQPRSGRGPLNIFSPPAPQSSRAARQPTACLSQQPTPSRSCTPWLRSQATAQNGGPPQHQSDRKSPTMSPLSEDCVSPGGAPDVSPAEGDHDVAGFLVGTDESAPPSRHSTPPRTSRSTSGTRAPSPPLISETRPHTTGPQPIAPFPDDGERHSSLSGPVGFPRSSPVNNGSLDENLPEQHATPASLPFSTSSSSGIDEAGPPATADPGPARGRTRHRRRDLNDAATISADDVHGVIQTVTRFHCDCEEGFQHDLHAEHEPFSLRELCHATGNDRCFPLRGEELPQPFDRPTAADVQADLSRIDFAQYLSTKPSEDWPRSKLRLRSTTTFSPPVQQNFTVTEDVDSVWLRLTDLSDLTVPLEVIYTAQRHVNIFKPQHVPSLSSDGSAEPDLHGTAHTVFAKTPFSSCTARIYVYWPYLKEHRNSVLTDDDFAVWIDGVVMPAMRTLDSCAWQDHPRSFKDARSRAYHRGEVQIGGSQGPGVVEYTLSARFTSPLVRAMREIVAAAGEASPLFRFRSFSFVMIVHDLKKALNAESPGFDAFVQFQHALAATFQAAYLSSVAFLDRSFADFGVEYNIKKQVTEPTTLLVRRTCIQHRLSSALAHAGGQSTAGIAHPQLFTTYSMYDAASARIIPPAKASMSTVIPMIKGYSLHKHTCNTHFRHHFSSPFSLPHLDLLCLTDGLLQDIHKGIAGTFQHRTATAIHKVLTQTLERLDEGQRATSPCHTGVRIEPRISLRHLFGLLEQENWPDMFDSSMLHPSRRHPFVFAVATADLNSFVRNYLQRMTVALAAQRFDIFGPVPGWNSMTVRHRLSTTAVLLKIMTTFFEGDQHKHYNLRVAKYQPKKKPFGVELYDEDGPLDLSVNALARVAPSVRVGLLMDDTLRRYGCYWLPHELFDFSPRLQLKPHLVSRITVARPRLLSKAQIHWHVPTHSRRAYEGDTVFDIVITAARSLKELRPLGDEDANYLRYQFQRMRAWFILKPVVRLLARAFFRYVASLTDKDPCFLPVPDNEFGVPFNALTYDAVTLLLGDEPILATPRESKKDGGKVDWCQRLQYMFNDSGQDQWQKTASYLVDLRRWIGVFKSEQVLECYIDLWRADMGLLMRPYVWILPSCEKKTLFRMDKVDAQVGVHKRSRTRWHLPGVVVKHCEPLMARFTLPRSGRRFLPTEGNGHIVRRVCKEQRKAIDPFVLARRSLRAMSDVNLRDKKARRGLIEQLIDTFDGFCRPSMEWFHEKVNDSSHAAGCWVPYWACGEPFPADDMNELQGEVEQHRANFEPDGGFLSVLEVTEDEMDDGPEEDEGYEEAHDDDD